MNAADHVPSLVLQALYMWCECDKKANGSRNVFPSYQRINQFTKKRLEGDLSVHCISLKDLEAFLGLLCNKFIMAWEKT